MKKKTWICLLIILILGIVLRLYDPTFRSLWGDEAHSVYSALKFSLSNLLHDSHFPIYFLLLSFWINLFGCAEYTLRLFSILIGISSLVIFYLIAKEWFDDEVGLIALFLLATSPLAIMHSQEIRMYGLLMMFSLLSCWTFWKLIQKQTLWGFVWYLIISVFLLFTHIYACLIFICQMIYAFVRMICKKSDFRILASQVLVGVLVAPFFIKILELNLMSVMQGTADMAFAVFPGCIKFILIYFVLTLGETMAPWYFLFVIPAGLIVLTLLLKSLRDIRNNKLIGFLWVLIFVPIFIAAFVLKPTMPKYLILILPFFIMLLAIGLKNISNLYLRYFLLAVLVFCQLVSVKNYFSLQEYHNSNQIEPWRAVAAQIHQNSRSNDIVLASNYFVVSRLLNYYLNIVGQTNCQVYDLETNKLNLNDKTIKRIWFVTNIHDDRQFSSGYISSIRSILEKHSKPMSVKKYIPYEATLVSKLPIKRHDAGSYRIIVELYNKRNY